MKRSKDDVIREIENFLADTGGAYDWDDFLSIPINDRQLDAIRIECSELREKHPPVGKRQYCSDEGIRRLEEILRSLEA